MNLVEFEKELGVKVLGEPVCAPLNCGAGLKTETLEGTCEDSYVVITRCNSAFEFNEFLSTLKATGRVESFHRETNGNIFSEYSGGGKKLVYTYYTAEKHEARVILDSVSLPVSQYDDCEKDVRGDTVLMQFSLRYGKMIRGYSCDCGMLYALRLRDNSVIIIDGGEREQATDDACDEFMKRLEELTNTEAGGKIRVAAWFCTHNHDDHMDVFVKLLRREKERLLLERVIFNFPSKTLYEYENPCTDRLKRALKECAPDAKYLKPHTGQTIRFPDATFEVLTTHEDILPLSKRARDEGPYRTLNETSTIVKITFDDCSVLFLGDAEETNGEELISLYGKNYLTCTFLQCAHHLINDVRNIYGNIKAKYLLIPQGRFIAVTRECENLNHVRSLFGDDNIFFAGDCTEVFTVKDGLISIDYFEQMGYLCDETCVLE